MDKNTSPGYLSLTGSNVKVHKKITDNKQDKRKKLEAVPQALFLTDATMLFCSFKCCCCLEHRLLI